MSYFSDLLKVKCPKCGKTNINTVKAGLGESAAHTTKQVGAALFFWPALFFIKKSKPLHVCTDCGFSWEKR